MIQTDDGTRCGDCGRLIETEPEQTEEALVEELSCVEEAVEEPET